MPHVQTEGLQVVKDRYLAMLPEIESRASYYHRDLKPCDREDAVSEALAWSWQWCLTAAEKGRLTRLTPHSLSRYARRMYRSGRRFAGSSSVCVLSPQTRAMRRVNVIPLDHLETSRCDGSTRARAVSDALTDSRRRRPDEVCRVDLDYAQAMRASALPSKAADCFRLLVNDHAHGHVKRIAATLGVTPPRVCQLKNALAQALMSIGYGPKPAPPPKAA